MRLVPRSGGHRPILLADWITREVPHFATADYLAKKEAEMLLREFPSARIVVMDGASYIAWPTPTAGGVPWWNVASLSGGSDSMLLGYRWLRGAYRWAWCERSREGARPWLRPLRRAVLAAVAP